MRVVLYRGARGTGKSLTMTRDSLKYYKLGWKILTNLDGTPFQKIDSSFIFSLDITSDLKNCVLVIDEIELFFDSREWNKKESRFFSRFLQQIRKRNVIILCTAQFTNLIDVRLRQQIDTLVICTFDKLLCLASCTYIDLTSLESNPLHPLSYISTYSPRPIFKYYDSYALI